MWCTKCTQAAATARLEETKKRDMYNNDRKAHTDDLGPYQVWSPLNMEEVYVPSVHHMSSETKLEWLRLELSGEAAYLDAFAAKFVQLFPP